MKIEVTICDRCGERVNEKNTVVQMQQGDWRISRDLCVLCKEVIVRELKVSTKTTKRSNGQSRLERDLSERLARVREAAARGVEEWADGASPEHLKQVLTDIASDARR